jgi:Xaa-Pro aminopeptidase
MTKRAFTIDHYAARMQRAAHEARAHGLSGMIVTPGPDLAYLCGYRPTTITGRLTALLVELDRPPTLFVPWLEFSDALAAAGPVVKLVAWADGSDPYRAFGSMLRPSGRYGISDPARAAHLLGLQRAQPAVQFVALTEGVPLLRAVKGAEELRYLAYAGAAADAVYREILSMHFAGRREADVAENITRLMFENGYSHVDCVVVGSGPNGAHPHHRAGDRVILEGDTVVLDFGGSVDGYSSGIARTVYLGQSPPGELRMLHDLVRRAQRAAFDVVKPGIESQEVDRAARRVIDLGGYGECVMQRTGQGVGLTGDEPPFLVEGDTCALQPGMCFSLEPWARVPEKFGMRIKDIVMVAEDGARRLNGSVRSLAQVR